MFLVDKETLTLKVPSEIAADDILFLFIFLEKIRLDISCILFAVQMIHIMIFTKEEKKIKMLSTVVIDTLGVNLF